MTSSLTVLAIKAGAHEANPLAKFLFNSDIIFFMKVMAPGMVLLLAYWNRAREFIHELTVRRAWFVVGIYSLVVVMNIFTWLHYLHA